MDANNFTSGVRGPKSEYAVQARGGLRRDGRANHSRESRYLRGCRPVTSVVRVADTSSLPASQTRPIDGHAPTRCSAAASTPSSVAISTHWLPTLSDLLLFRQFAAEVFMF